MNTFVFPQADFTPKQLDDYQRCAKWIFVHSILPVIVPVIINSP